MTCLPKVQTLPTVSLFFCRKMQLAKSSDVLNEVSKSIVVLNILIRIIKNLANKVKMIHAEIPFFVDFVLSYCPLSVDRISSSL